MIKKFDQYIKESGYTQAAENAGLYDDMTDLIKKANKLIVSHHNKPGWQQDEDSLEVGVPEDAIAILQDIASDEAMGLIEEIDTLSNEIDSVESEAFYKKSLESKVNENRSLGYQVHKERRSYRDMIWGIRSTGYSDNEGKLLEIIERLVRDIEKLENKS